MKFNESYIKDLEETINNIQGICLLNNKKVLITGSTGLIGSAIIDTLIWNNLKNKSNIQVYAAGRNKEKAKYRFGDVFNQGFFNFLDYDASKDITFDIDFDYIVHCASNAHPIAYSKTPVETMVTTFYGTNKILQYAKNHNVSRVIYVSSSEVYGEKENNELYNEEDYFFIDILNSRACYPSSKRAAETLCASYQRQHNIDVVIVRPGHIYGPTMTDLDSRASAQFARDVLKGHNIIMKSPGLQMRSYCYVFDCVSAMLTTLLYGKSGQAYNVSNKNSIVSIRELAESFARACKKEIIFENPDDIEAAGYNMMLNSALNAEKLEGLGWKGLYNIDEGVKRTIKILKENV